MAEITGGVVSVEDGTKKAEEYAPPRKVRVELHFDMPPEKDLPGNLGSALAFVGDVASAEVSRLLGQAVTAKPEYAPTQVIRTLDPPAAEKPKRQSRKAAADKTEGQQSTTDPLAGMGEPQAPAQEMIEGDPLADMYGAAPQEYTDADLNAAVQAKLKTLQNPQQIREYISTFGVKVLAEIPQERRNEFIDGLNKLS